MFVISRAGDTRSAAAATTEEVHTSARDSAITTPDPVALPPPAVALEATAAPTDALPVAAAPSVTHQPRASATRKAAAVTMPTRQVSTRKSPVSPRRDKRIDPDGTVDPY
jgi:hypothetical protein